MSLLVVGTIAYDSIVTPFGRGKKILGGSATYFSLAARHFEQPAVVSIVGADFKKRDANIFARNKIDTQGVAKVEGKTFAWGGEYGFDLNNRVTLFTHLNVLEKFNPRVPSLHQNAEYIFLGNFHPALQLQVLKQLKKPKFVACDTMNFWIENNFKELWQVLKKVDALLINDSELRELSKEYNLIKASKKILAQMGKGKLLVVKRGEYGVLVFRGRNLFYLPAFPLEQVFDPTGAGDSFAGGFMGFLAAGKKLTFDNFKKASVAGSVMGSFCVEKLGTARLLKLKQKEIRSRLKAFKSLTDFNL